MSCTIFVDESGDLGWNFAAAYRQGGSSRHLTIAAVCVPPEKSHFPKRIVKTLYKSFGWATARERKWTDMSAPSRTAFVEAARKMCASHADIHLQAVVVFKPGVASHIQHDPNKLYNFMIRACLLERMGSHATVTLITDKRSIRVGSERSLHDYLQTELWFGKGAKTILTTTPQESHQFLGLQFADMLAGVVQSHFEDGAKDFLALRTNLDLFPLYFP